MAEHSSPDHHLPSDRRDERVPGSPRVAILAGGSSLERQVSLDSARHVRASLADHSIPAQVVDVDDDLLDRLDHFDVAFVATHGRPGEDGTLQAQLDLADIAYVGSPADAAALSWNKHAAAALLRRAGLHTPSSLLLSQSSLNGSRAVQQALARVELPVVVKPVRGGSAQGVGIVTHPDQLPHAVLAAWSYCDELLIQPLLEGTELAVPVCGDRALGVVEITPRSGVYDFAARYTHGATTFHLPARLADDALHRARRAALAAWRAIGGRHLGRVDIIVDTAGTPWVLEVATSPGLTATSVVPLAAEQLGGGFGGLLADLVRSLPR